MHTLYFPVTITPLGTWPNPPPILLLKLSPEQAAFANCNLQVFQKVTANLTMKKVITLLFKLGFREVLPHGAHVHLCTPEVATELAKIIGATPADITLRFEIDISMLDMKREKTA